MKELIEAAEFLLSAMPEGDHEKYGGYRFGCTCPRCRLVLAVSAAKKEPPPKFLQRPTMSDERVLQQVSKAIPYNDNEGSEEIEKKRVLLAFRLGMIG
jgi:hypothetical protein